MGFLIFISSTVLTAFIVYIYGRHDERYAMSVLIAAYTGTAIMYRIAPGDWLTLNGGILIVDLLALGALSFIAYRSSMIWPIAIAALHAATIISMLVIWLAEDLASHGVGLLQTVWTYPQLGILIWAALDSKKLAKR